MFRFRGLVLIARLTAALGMYDTGRCRNKGKLDLERKDLLYNYQYY